MLLKTLMATAGLLAAMLGQAQDAPMQPITLTAADGAHVFGYLYPAKHPKALILLFHQAQSNAGEYAPIAPRLVAAGYSALAIDQRSGAARFGSANQTVLRLGRDGAAYLEAQQDLEAAVQYGIGTALPLAILGSSYSSSLAFLVAAKHADIKAVLAFSPGEYFDTPDLVRRAAAKVNTPVFITSAKDADEIKEAAAIFQAVASPLKMQFVPSVAGVHGASTLRADSNPRGSEENWTALLKFLHVLFR